MNKDPRRLKRKLRIRSKINGSSDRPRLSIYRSTKFIYAQIIDDADGKTLCSAYTGELEGKDAKKSYKSIEHAKKLGKLIAEKASNSNIKSIVFDRNGYIYHGKIKAFADAVRENGLEF